jgi:hypothetical protein
MKLSDIAVNVDAIEGGRWVSIDHIMPGVKLKVRGSENSDLRRLRNKLLQEIPRAQRLRGAGEETLEAIGTRLLAETVLVDWSGIEDENGEPLPFSKEKAASVLGDPAMFVFKNAVEWAAGVVGDDEVVEAQEAAKN